jgi:hypothetical protein
MKPDPGNTARVFEQILALKDKRVLVIDQLGQRYEGFLQPDGEYLISGFKVVSDAPPEDQVVVAVNPCCRVLDITGSTIKVDLSRTVDVWVQGPGVLEEESFFESNVGRIKPHDAQAQDQEAAEREAKEISQDSGENDRTHRQAFERTHYLGPGEVIRSISLTRDGVVVWVDRLPAKKRRSKLA